MELNTTNEKLYERIADFINEKIISGEYSAGEKLPTEQALAKMFNVSRITSKRALDELAAKGVISRSQGRGSFVTAAQSAPPVSQGKWKGNIIVPSAGKSAPLFSGINKSSDDKKVVAMILPYDILQGRLAEIVQSATMALEERGYHLTLHNSGETSENERAIFARIVEDNVSGVIIYPTTDSNNIDMLYDMWLHQMPIVAVDKKIVDIPISFVSSKNYQGSYDLTEYLISKGHKRIGCLFNVFLSAVYSARQRYFGFCAAMKRHDIGIDYNFVEHNYSQRSFGMTSEENIMLLTEHVKTCVDSGMTALMLENDYIALDILKACKQAGIRVPDDLSIVGFDNLPQCEFSTPALTTCEQDFKCMGSLVGELILMQMEHRDFTFVEHSVPTKLCIRDSVRDI